MRVLQIINNLEHAGAEALLCDTALEMAQRGHEVHVATLFAYAQTSLRDRLHGSPVALHDVGLHIRFDPRALLRIHRLVRVVRPDVVHAHLFPALYWTALAGSFGAVRVVTEHSTLNRRRQSALTRGLDRKIYGIYEHVVCISAAVRDALLGAHPALAERTCVVHNGIDLRRFAGATPISRSELGIPEGTPLVVMVSRMAPPHKDHATLLRAMARLPDTQLLLVGSGPAESALRSQADSLGIAARVHFMGHRTDVARILSTCDICVQSSTYEGFCLVLVEAMACGLPVVVSDIAGAREVVEPDKTGLLFPVGDDRGLANRLSQLLRSALLRSTLGAAGLVKAQEFSITRSVDSLLKIYSGCPGEHTRTLQ